MAKLAIKGHSTRGNEVIEILEMLGGKNTTNLHGECDNMIYIINSSYYGEIIYMLYRTDGYVVFTLEEFLEKFPHKVGDKVCFSDDLSTPFTINKMWWDENANELLCSFIEDDIEVPVVGIRTYKEKSIDKTNKVIFEANTQSCDIMNDIIKEEDSKNSVIYDKIDFNRCPAADKVHLILGNNYEIKEENGKYYVVRKKPQYPKTCEECLKILGKTMNSLDNMRGYKYALFMRLQQLLISREAYWKIAGEQMGLGKPWKPDWEDETEIYYTISYDGVNIKCYNDTDVYSKLAFPTEEMRDAFYENFKELIESCKELL